MKKARFLSLLLALCLVCGAVLPAPAQAASFNFTTGASTLGIGTYASGSVPGTTTLTATASTGAIYWSVSPADIVELKNSNTGATTGDTSINKNNTPIIGTGRETINVTPLHAGKVEITAKTSNGTFTSPITVLGPIERIDLSDDDKGLTLFVGETRPLSSSIWPPAASDRNSLTWTVAGANAGCVSLSGSGSSVQVTGVDTKVGQATAEVTVTANNNLNAKDTCKVTVTQPLTGITLDKTSANLAIDGIIKVSVASTAPNYAYNKDIGWTHSSNLEVQGTPTNNSITVKAVGTGPAWVVATAKEGPTYNKASARCDIKIDYAAAQTVSVTPASVTLPKGLSIVNPIQATVEPGTARPDAEWSSSDTGVANVTRYGWLTTSNYGDATLTAKGTDANGNPLDSVSAQCAVKVAPLTVTVRKGETTTTVSSGETLQINEGEFIDLRAILGADPVVSPDGPADADYSYLGWYKGADLVKSKERDFQITADSIGPAGTSAVYHAKAGDEDISFTVEVAVVPVTGISLADFELDVTSFPTKDLAAEILTFIPPNATDQRIEWSSSNPDVVEVDKDTGAATAKSKGTSFIVAKSLANPAAIATCTATVTDNAVPVDSLELNPPSLLFESAEAGAQGVAAVVGPEKATNKRVVWSVAPEGVVQLEGMTADGLDHNITVAPLSPGEAEITATTASNNKDGVPITKTCSVTVSGAAIEAKDGVVTVKLGETVNLKDYLKLYGSARDLSSGDWLWTSEDEGIARVAATTGIVSGVKVGETTVTCRNGSTSATVKVKVTDEDEGNIINRTMTGDRYGLGGVLTGDIPTLPSQCDALTGFPLSYVTDLSVDSEQGTLYYGYVSEAYPGEGVAVTDKFYNSDAQDQKQLSRISFVPRRGFYGVAVIRYTAFAENGKSYPGVVHLTVQPAAEIAYTSQNGEAVHLHSDDFSNYCKGLYGYPVSSVRFTGLPPERCGYLYYDYNGGDIYAGNVPVNREYYVSTAPLLGSVSFVPRSGYTGTFTIPFTAEDTAGNLFKGVVRVTVGHGEGDINYTAVSGQRFYFEQEDFAALCKAHTGGTLISVAFSELPGASQGVMYLGGGLAPLPAGVACSTGSTGALLRDVNILSTAGFLGDILIPFTGMDRDGKTFSGTVCVTVVQNSGQAATIYLTSTGMPVSFSRTAFVDACSGVLPGQLKSVRFQLPGGQTGKLYARFDGLNDNKLLEEGKDLSAPDLLRLTFVPKGSFSGSAYLSYTAADNRGNTCTGTVRVAVWPAEQSQYFNDMKRSVWSISSVDFLRRFGVVTGTTGTTYAPIQQMRRCDFILMLARAFDLPSVGTASFPDVPTGSYYATAVAAAKQKGIALGDASGRFRPTEGITRQEAAVFLYRTLQAVGKDVTPGGAADLVRFPDGDQVPGYAVEAMATLANMGVFQGDGLGRLNPNSTLTRAEMAVILHRAVT